MGSHCSGCEAPQAPRNGGAAEIDSREEPTILGRNELFPDAPSHWNFGSRKQGAMDECDLLRRVI